MAGFGKASGKGPVKRQSDQAVIPLQSLLQEVLQLYQQGQFVAAKARCEQLLQRDPQQAFAIGCLASIESRLGQRSRAEQLFRRSLELNPQQPDFWHNFAGLLIDQARWDAAIACSRQAIGLNAANASYWERIGFALWQSGALAEALQATQQALQLDPANQSACLNAAGILRQDGQPHQARAVLEALLQQQPAHVDALSNLACIDREQGQLDDALALVTRAISLQPDHVDSHINAAIIFRIKGQLRQANDAVAEALRLGIQSSMQAALVLEHYEVTNQAELLEQALQHLAQLLGSDHQAVLIYSSRLQFRQKRYELSLATIQAVDQESLQSLPFFLQLSYWLYLGFAEDKAGHYNDAYQAFAKAQGHPWYAKCQPARIIEAVRDALTLCENVSSSSARSSQAQPVVADVQPVFLMGFPRSGTTLLDTILRSHPEIEVVEECDALNHTLSHAQTNFGLSLNELDRLSAQQLHELREVYVARLRGYCETEASTIIDKNPLSTIAVPFIHLLYPRAKIIFAVRHPCDCVLSCFQQVFEPNDTMAHFVTLQSSAQLYNTVMSAWQVFQSCLPIHFMLTRYEDLVDDFQQSTTRLLAHLGLHWHEGLQRYQQTAQQRPLIRTPSASQVIQPIYRTSINKWINYHTHFQDCMPYLEPWIQHWGYGAVAVEA